MDNFPYINFFNVKFWMNNETIIKSVDPKKVRILMDEYSKDMETESSKEKKDEILQLFQNMIFKVNIEKMHFLAQILESFMCP